MRLHRSEGGPFTRSRKIAEMFFAELRNGKSLPGTRSLNDPFPGSLYERPPLAHLPSNRTLLGSFFQPNALVNSSGVYVFCPSAVEVM